MVSKPALESSDANKILFARFHLNIDPIKDYRVRVLNFPAQKAISEFLGQIGKLDGKESDEIYNPPYQRLNAALLYLAPTLIHGFERKSDWNRDRHSIALAEPPSLLFRQGNLNSLSLTKESDFKEADRETITLAEPVAEDSLWYPKREQITDVISVWAKQWAIETFAKKLEKEDAKELVENLTNQIRFNPESDWREHTIGEVWNSTQGVDKSLRWKTIPSLLAMLFVAKSPSLELGEENGSRQRLTWSLTHDRNTGLAIISNPIPARSVEHGEGLIAYKLEFRVQTQAGNTEHPWIALYIGLRRYASDPVVNKNDDRNVSVYTRMGTRIRKEGWGKSQTLVQLKAKGKINKNRSRGVEYKLEWQDTLSDLISELRVREPLSPNDLFSQPADFQPASDTDTYLITYTEGMKYKSDKKTRGHSIKSGTSLAERIDLFTHVFHVLGDILEPDQAMEVDTIATLSSRDIAVNQMYGLLTAKEIQDLYNKKTKEAQRLKNTYQNLIPQALQHTGINRQTHVYVLHTKDENPRAFRHYLHKLLMLEEKSLLSSSIQIHHLHFSDSHGFLNEKLNVLFDRNTYYASNNTQKDVLRRKYHNDMREVHEKRVERVKKFLSTNINPQEQSLALIELPEKFDSNSSVDQWLKYTLRRACVEMGLPSQMIRPINDEIAERSTPPLIPHIVRLKNALNDLLLRQTGILLSTPTSLYHYAGLPSEISENLCVIGLYRHRTQFPRELDFPIAVRFFANGYVDFILSDPKTGLPLEPVAYIQGTRLGKYLQEYMNSNLLKFRPQKWDRTNSKFRLARFAKEIILKTNQQCPTLLLLEADGWRQSGVLPVSNENIRYNTLNVEDELGSKNYTIEDLPNIRMIRVREAGTLGETPQYIQVEGGIWGDTFQTKDIEHMTLVRDNSVESDIPHAFSIGRRLISMGDQRNDNYSFSDGADTAHKHQRAVEMALFFHQPDDDINSWLRIPHLLRVSPAWNGGNVMLPYPIHLAKALVEDMLDALPPDIDFKNL